MVETVIVYLQNSGKFRIGADVILRCRWSLDRSLYSILHRVDQPCPSQIEGC